jgi:hypothetical protein
MNVYMNANQLETIEISTVSTQTAFAHGLAHQVGAAQASINRSIKLSLKFIFCT